MDLIADRPGTPSTAGARENIRSRPWARRLLLAAPLFALVTLFIATDLRGVNFGVHWDEADWQIRPVREMVASGILLPRATIYPAFSKWLVLLPAVPVGIKAIFSPNSSPPSVQAAMLAAIDRPEYLLDARGVFIVFSAFAIFWAYGVVLALRRSWGEALVAAAGLGLSWEYAYHARWVATDCVVVHFSALTLFLLAMFFRARRVGWLYGAAVAAGFGTGAKFPGVTLLAPVMLASILTLPIRDWRTQLPRLVVLGVLAFVAYLVTTPATVFEPFAFVDELARISDYYRRGHYLYTVANPWQHLKLVFIYMALEYFSPYHAVAVPLFVSAIVGAVLWIRSDRRIGAVLISFPIAFLCFFCFRYLAMIARNYLLIAPFLSVLMARSIGEIMDRLRHWWARWCLTGLLLVVGGANAIWLVRAGESIRNANPKSDVRQAVTYVANHPKTRFRLSPRVKALAAEQHLAIPVNATDAANPGAVVFFARSEGPDPFHWNTNDPWLTLATFGPHEINLNWYAGWIGYDRVVAMTIEKARATGVVLAK
jgi:hypothetical protein